MFVTISKIRQKKLEFFLRRPQIWDRNWVETKKEALQLVNGHQYHSTAVQIQNIVFKELQKAFEVRSGLLWLKTTRARVRSRKSRFESGWSLWTRAKVRYPTTFPIVGVVDWSPQRVPRGVRLVTSNATHEATGSPSFSLKNKNTTYLAADACMRCWLTRSRFLMSLWPWWATRFAVHLNGQWTSATLTGSERNRRFRSGSNLHPSNIKTSSFPTCYTKRLGPLRQAGIALTHG